MYPSFTTVRIFVGCSPSIAIDGFLVFVFHSFARMSHSPILYFLLLVLVNSSFMKKKVYAPLYGYVLPTDI